MRIFFYRLFNIFIYSIMYFIISEHCPQFLFHSHNLQYPKNVFWFLSIMAMIFLWIKFLYILRKSPCGLYILMLWKILKTFINMCFIWISTLICFSSLFGLIIMQTRMINKYHCEQEKRKNVILSMFNDSFVNNNGDHLSTCNKDIGGDIWEEAVSLQKLFRYEFV